MLVTTTTSRRLKYWRLTKAAFDNFCKSDTTHLICDDGSSESDLAEYGPVLHAKGHVASLSMLWNYARNTNFVFHLEDDWVMTAGCDIEDVALSIMAHDSSIIQVIFYHKTDPSDHAIKRDGYWEHQYNGKKWRPLELATWPGFALGPSYINLKEVLHVGLDNVPNFEYHFSRKISTYGWKVAYTPVNYFRHIGGISAYDLNHSRR